MSLQAGEDKDKTEKIPTQKESRSQETKSELENELLRSLVGELQPTLTNMKTALSLLLSPQIKKEQRQRYLELIQRECDRQNSLINGLQELINIDNIGETELTERVHLEELVPGIVSTYQPLAQEKGIMLGYTIPPDLPPVASTTTWVKQIIVNLLHNSLKFTPSKGRVIVQAALKDKYIAVTISDTGRGIPQSDIPKIFNSFYRGKTTIAEEQTSAGLGLTIVQKILKNCGGSISVTSSRGNGSTFTVLLPIAVEPT